MKDFSDVRALGGDKAHGFGKIVFSHMRNRAPSDQVAPCRSGLGRGRLVPDVSLAYPPNAGTSRPRPRSFRCAHATPRVLLACGLIPLFAESSAMTQEHPFGCNSFGPSLHQGLIDARAMPHQHRPCSGPPPALHRPSFESLLNDAASALRPFLCRFPADRRF